MSSHASLQHFIQPLLLCLTVSALLLFLSATQLHAAPEVVLRLDPGGHTANIWKIVTAFIVRTLPFYGRKGTQRKGQLIMLFPKICLHNFLFES
jgi:hypothetical protein